jgi:hypothetical protein
MIPLDVFVCEENISLYKKLLADRHISDRQRDVIGNMLAEEEAKLLRLFDRATSPRETFTDRFAARANIDHCLGLLYDARLTPGKRATITKLLIQDEDNLAHDLEQLEFAEKRAADGRNRLNHLRSRLILTPERLRAQAEQLVANFESTQILLDDFCHRLRNKVNSGH